MLVAQQPPGTAHRGPLSAQPCPGPADSWGDLSLTTGRQFPAPRPVPTPGSCSLGLGSVLGAASFSGLPGAAPTVCPTALTRRPPCHAAGAAGASSRLGAPLPARPPQRPWLLHVGPGPARTQPTGQCSSGPSCFQFLTKSSPLPCRPQCAHDDSPRVPSALALRAAPSGQRTLFPVGRRPPTLLRVTVLPFPSARPALWCPCRCPCPRL